jgi:hypothetical protein
VGSFIHGLRVHASHGGASSRAADWIWVAGRFRRSEFAGTGRPAAAEVALDSAQRAHDPCSNAFYLLNPPLLFLMPGNLFLYDRAPI